MLYRFSAVLVMLVVCAGSLSADDKEKKEGTKFKGTVVKHDEGKVTLKTSEGEKEFKLGSKVDLIPVGAKKSVPLTTSGRSSDESLPSVFHKVMNFVMHPGNELELVVVDDAIREIHMISVHRDAPEPPAVVKKAASKSGKEEDKKDDKN